MKKYLWMFLFAALAACGDDAAKDVNDNTANNETKEAMADETTAVGDLPNKGEEGSFLPPLDPGESPMVTTLTTAYWVFEYYVVDDRAQRAANKGRWFQFFPDGTFSTGVWQEQTGYGVWRLEEEPEGLMLYLDSINDTQDEKWEIQGVNDVRDTMTWAGISETPNAGVITKTINLLSQPTKKQFGVE